jgi:hypothetical protein
MMQNPGKGAKILKGDSMKKKLTAFAVLLLIIFQTLAAEVDFSHMFRLEPYPAEPFPGTEWVAPEPDEKSLFGFVLASPVNDPARHRQTLLRYAGTAGVLAGLLAAAGGVGTIFVAAGTGDRISSATVHGGLLMIISGSLITAVSSSFLGALGANATE